MKKNQKTIGIETFRKRTLILPLLAIFLFEIILMAGLNHFSDLQNKTNTYLIYEHSLKEIQKNTTHMAILVQNYTKTLREESLKKYGEDNAQLLKSLKSIRSYADDFAEDAIKNSLQDTLNLYSQLEEKEIYAITLVTDLDSLDYKVFQEGNLKVELSPEDLGLNDDERQKKAEEMVSDQEFKEIQLTASVKTNETISQMIQRISMEQENAVRLFRTMFLKINIGLAVILLVSIFFGYFIRKMLISPLYHLNQSIKNGEADSSGGVNEVQMMANHYNEIIYKDQTIQRLMRHEGEQDPLTKTLTRKSFDTLINIYKKGDVSYAVIMVEVDEYDDLLFKEDCQKKDDAIRFIGDTLMNNFRRADFVFRMDQYKFAVLAINTNSTYVKVIHSKTVSIKEQLQKGTETVPGISVSIGIAFSDRLVPGESVYKFSEDALEYVKEHGGNDCAVF